MSKGVADPIKTNTSLPLFSSVQSKTTATILGLAAEIEREFISMRTKEALAARKSGWHWVGQRMKIRHPNLMLNEIRFRNT